MYPGLRLCYGCCANNDQRLWTDERNEGWNYKLINVCSATLRRKAYSICIFDCEFTRIVWNKVQVMCLTYRGNYTLGEELAWMATHWISKSFAHQLKWLCLSATVYHTWRLRNTVIFRAGHASTAGLLKEIIEAASYVISSWTGFPGTQENWTPILELGIDWNCIV